VVSARSIGDAEEAGSALPADRWLPQQPPASYLPKDLPVNFSSEFDQSAQWLGPTNAW